jgi:hypothetical protein
MDSSPSPSSQVMFFSTDSSSEGLPVEMAQFILSIGKLRQRLSHSASFSL